MQKIKDVLLVLLLGGIIHASPQANAAEPVALEDGTATETIVCIRHGEKPEADLGQLNLKGLNRALALPDVLIAKYGKPKAIFAPGTQHRITRDGVEYSYIRPLMTIEPTAIRLGLPVDAKFAFDEIEPLEKELLSPAYKNSVVFVAWEHHMLEELVKNLVKSAGQNPSSVPEWPKLDFDSIYIVKIRTEGSKKTATFEHDQEGLDGQSGEPPSPRGK